MKDMKGIGLVLILIGLVYAGFWLTGLNEWNYGARLQQGQLTKTQFEEKCPVLKLVFRWYDFAPFDNTYEDRCIRPGFFVHRGIVRHSILGGALILLGAGIAGIAVMRGKRHPNTPPELTARKLAEVQRHRWRVGEERVLSVLAPAGVDACGAKRVHGAINPELGW